MPRTGHRAPHEPSGGADPRPGGGEMFDRIAHRYDLLNRLMSFGIDRRWRRLAIDALALRPGSRILDLAAGTGDLSLAALARGPDIGVVGVDPSPEMLARAREKGDRRGVGDRLELRTGVAEDIPAERGEFDGACIGFGIRNVPDRARALAEMARVVKPGGRVSILELSEPKSRLIGALARLYIHRVVPRLGALVSGHSAYRYLERSIAAFPPAAEFAAMMAAEGLAPAEVRPLTFGVCHLYVGEPAGEP